MQLPTHITCSIEHNPHKIVHQTMEEYLSSWLLTTDDFYSEEDRQRCLNADDFWMLIWYPNTVVANCRVVASSPELAIRTAIRKETAPTQWREANMSTEALPGFAEYLEQRKRVLASHLEYGRLPDDEPTLPAWLIDEIRQAYAAGNNHMLSAREEAYSQLLGAATARPNLAAALTEHLNCVLAEAGDAREQPERVAAFNLDGVTKLGKFSSFASLEQLSTELAKLTTGNGSEAIAASMAVNALETIIATRRLAQLTRTGCPSADNHDIGERKEDTR